MIKENILRKNLLTNEIDTGSIDTIFAEINKKALDKNGNVVKPESIIQDHPYIEATLEEIEAFELDNLREQKKSEVDRIKNELELTLEYNGTKYDIDTKAQTSFIMYKDLIEKGQLQEPIYWVSADNKNIQLTITEFTKIINAGRTQLQKIRLNRQPLKELINNMSEEELNALDIKAELLK